MEKTGVGIGVIGGVGLGLLLGSEFSGSIVTVIGAVLIIVSFLSMGYLFVKEK